MSKDVVQIKRKVSEMKLYAIIRADIQMAPGKMAAQAGHAFLNSFLEASPDVQSEYQKYGIGTKITKECHSLDHMLEAYKECNRLQIPCSLITDSGHVHPPHFDGSPIITALGIGPCDPNDITNRFALYTGDKENV